LGILLIASLARIVGAQGHAAHAGKLLGRNLGIFLVIKLLPEILVEPAAVHLGLGHDRGGHWAGKRGKRNGSDGKALHDSSPYPQVRRNSRRFLSSDTAKNPQSFNPHDKRVRRRPALQARAGSPLLGGPAGSFVGPVTS